MISNRTLNALGRHNIKLEDLPRLYKERLLDEIEGIGKKGTQELIDYVKENATINTLSDLIFLSYDELVEYLLNKYGKPNGSYFRNESCSTINSKLSRASEGLQIHHIKEYEVPLLSDKYVAREHPYEYQSELVYCNLIEHFLLHVKIESETGIKNEGIEYIRKNIIDCYTKYFNEDEFKTDRSRNLLNAIKDDYFEFKKIADYYAKSFMILFYKY